MESVALMISCIAFVVSCFCLAKTVFNRGKNRSTGLRPPDRHVMTNYQVENEVERQKEYEERVKKSSEMIYHYAVAQAMKDIKRR